MPCGRISEVGTAEVDGRPANLECDLPSLESDKVMGSGRLALYHQNSKASAKHAMTMPAAMTMKTPPKIFESN